MTEELCENLHGLGVKATLLELGSPEAFTWPPYILGCVKIEERNIDMIMIQLSQDEDYIAFSYYYVVRANVNGLEKELKANYKSYLANDNSQKQNPDQLGHPVIDRNIPDFYWKGGELAELLNTDSDLTSTLQSEGLNSINIWPDRRRYRVMIIGKKQFLTCEALEAYNRIAYSVRRFIISNSLTSTSEE